MLPQEAAAEPDLRDYLEVLRRRKAIIAVVICAFLGLALTLSYFQTTSYAATAKLLLRLDSTTSIFSNGQQQNLDPGRSVQTEIEVIKTEPVEDLVRAKIGSAPSVQVSPVGQTDLVTIRAEDEDPKRAAAIANAYANAYIDFRRKQALDDLSSASEEVQGKITDLQKQLDNLATTLANAPNCVDARTTPDACAQRDNVQQTVTQRRTTLLSQLGLFQQRLDQMQVDSALTTGSAQLVTPASAPKTPFKPTPVRNAIVGIVVGGLFAVGLAFLREYLDDSIKTKADFERAVPGLAVLGLIPIVPDWKARDQSRVISLTNPTSPTAEAYRILRTSIQFIGLERELRVIQVTSASAQEGKTTTLANLAVAFASSGLRTIAVCCDLRRPRLHEFFGRSNEIGFTSVLLGSAPLHRSLQTVEGQDRLLLLASGPLPPNPAELLSSPRTAELFRNLAADADIVLIDSPPVLPVTDALVLSQRCDSTVVVSSARVTTRKAAQRATEMLRQVNAPLIGAVLNGTTEEAGYGGYSSRYYSAALASPSITTADGNGAATKERSRRRGRTHSRQPE